MGINMKDRRRWPLTYQKKLTLEDRLSAQVSLKCGLAFTNTVAEIVYKNNHDASYIKRSIYCHEAYLSAGRWAVPRGSCPPGPGSDWGTVHPGLRMPYRPQSSETMSISGETIAKVYENIATMCKSIATLCQTIATRCETIATVCETIATMCETKATVCETIATVYYFFIQFS